MPYISIWFIVRKQNKFIYCVSYYVKLEPTRYQIRILHRDVAKAKIKEGNSIATSCNLLGVLENTVNDNLVWSFQRREQHHPEPHWKGTPSSFVRDQLVANCLGQLVDSTQTHTISSCLLLFLCGGRNQQASMILKEEVWLWGRGWC